MNGRRFDKMIRGSVIVMLSVALFAGVSFAGSNLIIKVSENPLDLYDDGYNNVGVLNNEAHTDFSTRAEAGKVPILEEKGGLLKVRIGKSEIVWVDELDVVVGRQSKYVPPPGVLKRYLEAQKSQGYASSGLGDD